MTEAITIGRYTIEWTEGGILLIHDNESDEMMEANEDKFAAAIQSFWEQEF